MALIVILGFSACGYLLWKQCTMLGRIERMLQNRYADPFEDERPDPLIIRQRIAIREHLKQSLSAVE